MIVVRVHAVDVSYRRAAKLLVFSNVVVTVKSSHDMIPSPPIFTGSKIIVSSKPTF